MRPKFSTIILAAGKGTRMKTSLAKVAHPVAGQPMIQRVVRAAKDSGAQEVRVVIGVGSNMVRQLVEPLGALCFVQENPRGTADAVRSAEPDTLSGDVVILNGDHPLIEPKDIESAVKRFGDSQAAVAVLTCKLSEPESYGRIVRTVQGRVAAIVEAKDATPEVLKIQEINTGIYIARGEILNRFLPQIASQNAQKEFYLTDLVELTVAAGLTVEGIQVEEQMATGVNSQIDLAHASKVAYQRKARVLMNDGVILIDPDSTYIEDAVQVGAGSVIYPGVFLRGRTILGEYCVVEPGCMVVDARLANHVHLKSGCYVTESEISANAVIGPYAHLRPQTQVGEDCRVGNFVEMKKVKFGKGAKAGHLTYLGDAEIGENTNIGCGTITCNYAVDKKKYVTKIGKDVFVGSDTQFVAPVEVGDGAMIGSGSTITKDVPAKALAVTRAHQVIKENYTPKSKKES